jgi:dolichol-phosphate mannosyltransferase
MIPPMTAQTERDLTLLSVVAPIFNEEETVRELHRRLASVLDGIRGTDYEVVLVDDGSTDGTPELLRDLARDDRRVRVLTLSRNFGQQAALTAGMDHARGDAVVTIDADLQDPPELIPKMLEEWRRGSDVILAVRRRRLGESRMKLTTARWFYRVFARLAQIDFEQETGDFRLLDRSALDALGAMRERARFLRGMTIWVGFRQTAVPYERDARFAGETKFPMRKMLRFSFDALTSFSNVPLQMATLLGFTFALVAFVGIPLAVLMKLLGLYVSGIATVLLFVALLGGVQLIAVGIIGEYLGRVYDEVKRRPLYVVSERTNMAAPNPELSETEETQYR